MDDKLKKEQRTKRRAAGKLAWTMCRWQDYYIPYEVSDIHWSAGMGCGRANLASPHAETGWVVGEHWCHANKTTGPCSHPKASAGQFFWHFQLRAVQVLILPMWYFIEQNSSSRLQEHLSAGGAVLRVSWQCHSEYRRYAIRCFAASSLHAAGGC